MRLRPVSRPSRLRPVIDRDAAFTGNSDLRAIVLRMITTNSLAAFTQEISRRPGLAEPVRGATGSPPLGATAGGAGSAPDPQRLLEVVPPQPVRPVPRGSLLDLRV